MKALVIAEKPSVARDIARVLKCGKKINGAIEGERYIVTWGLGHLVTLADPEDYDKKYKQDLWFLPGIKECEFRYRKRQADRPAGTKWKRKNNHSSNDCRSGNSGQRRDHY